MKQQSAGKWRLTGILFIIAIVIKLVALNSSLVEHVYSTGIYIYISRVLRVLFGWLPLSIGDLVYSLAVLWLIIQTFRFVRMLIMKRTTKQKLVAGCRQLLHTALFIYIVFNIFWGLNYDREGIAYQLKLQPQQTDSQELDSLTTLLLQKVNASRKRLPDQVQYLSHQKSFSAAVTAYQSAQEQYPFLAYRFSSIKVSCFSMIGNYLGFSGYYNPFTAEAQVNGAVPPFLIPYIACHEMAHQLGYASEDEANFAGYLAARSSDNAQFQYSVYFDLFNYANGELFLHDSLAAKSNYRQLDTLVKEDILSYRKYLKEYKNPIEPLITILYGKYLKVNNQPEGIKTYSRVTAWLIAYWKSSGQL